MSTGYCKQCHIKFFIHNSFSIYLDIALYKSRYVVLDCTCINTKCFIMTKNSSQHHVTRL